MLDFFRRHQKYFFIVITFVIVISFSFFGTYSSLSNSSFREQIAFKRIDGSDITRHQLDEMVNFISTDAIDKRLFGGVWGPNFLNDGVIAKDFIETGLGNILALQYTSEMKPDLIARLEKEKRYGLYVHPQAKFIGVEAAWNYFAPQMSVYYNQMRSAQDPFDPAALQARGYLFLMEKQFPQQILRQVLQYQEKQAGIASSDKTIDQADLSLFGYHTAEDWFGPRFIRLAAQFIMNAAVIAEEQGITVSKADVLADLAIHSEESYQQNIRSANLGVTTSQDYYNEQLRRLGIDQNGAVAIWRQVMLFRRLFQEMGHSVVLDQNTFQKLNIYALESVKGKLYTIPKSLQLNNAQSLLKFEVYLEIVAKQTESEKAKLLLPSTFLDVAEVQKNFPELVQKRYLLEVAQVNKKSLEEKVGLKESWDFEVSDKGFDQLKNKFPELATKLAKTREERFAALDSLNNKTRQQVNAFARQAIVKTHPEWVKEALTIAPVKTITVKLSDVWGSFYFPEIKEGKELKNLLDKNDVLPEFTSDNNTVYKIKVIDRSKNPEILTFEEANEAGVLDKQVDKKLEAFYVTLQQNNPTEFRKADKAAKAFSDVKNSVTEKYMEKLVKSIKTNYALAINPKKAPDEMITDYAATLRFYPYFNDVSQKIKKDSSLIDTLTKEKVAQEKETTALNPRLQLNDQWLLEKLDYGFTRSSGDNLVDPSAVWKMNKGEWSDIHAASNGNLNIFYLEDKANNSTNKNMIEVITKTRHLLSADAKQRLMYHVLLKIQDKQAISLEYMNPKTENIDN